MQQELNGMVAVVTGASRGIGAAIALELARAGAKLALAARDRGNLDKIAAQIGPEALVVPTDVSQSDSLEALISSVHKHFGRLDLVVNNAGITRDGLLMRMKDADWDDVIQTNLRSAFVVSRAAGKIMVRQKSGRIINITSVIGVIGNAGQANYSASKAGVIGLTKSMARELASRGICINAVAPGYIETDMTAGLADKVREQIQSQIPMQSLGTPQDVAGMVRFLAGPASRYVTGQVFHVDGGMVM